MNQKQKTLTLLGGMLVVLLAVGTYAWFGVYQVDSKKQAEKERTDVLLPFPASAVEALAITAGPETTSLVRDGETFKITSPVKTAADKATAEGVASRLAGLKMLRAVGDQKDLKPFGLDSPRLKIAITAGAGKAVDGGAATAAGSFEFDLGDDNSYDGTIFAKLGSSPRVVIVETGVKAALTKSLFDLREKRVIPFEQASLKHLDVATPKLAYALDHVGEGQWKLTAPMTDTADTTKANQIATALSGLKAIRFATEHASQEDLARYGLDHPGDTVVLTFAGDGGQKTLVLAQVTDGKTPHAYAKRAEEGWIAEVPLNIFKDLEVQLMDLRDKTVLVFEPADARGLRFTSGGSPFEAKREMVKPPDGGAAVDSWTLEAGAKGVAKRWKLSGLLSNLHNLKGATIAADPATPAQLTQFGLDKPTKTATVLGEAGKVLAVLEVGKTQDNKAYVRSAAAQRVYQVDSYRLGDLPTATEDLADLPPPPPAAPDAGAPDAGKK
jgi:Domain of unknown function (DUF4340)